MHLAAEEGCVRVVRLLAETEESRKTIFEQDEDANTPLHLAAKRGNALVAKTLLEFGSDVKVRCRKLLRRDDGVVIGAFAGTQSTGHLCTMQSIVDGQPLLPFCSNINRL